MKNVNAATKYTQKGVRKMKKPPSPTVPPPEELVSMFFKWAEPSDTYKAFTCLPYISNLTEPLTRLLRNNEIRVFNKLLKTL